jgi:hypothetical protein
MLRHAALLALLPAALLADASSLVIAPPSHDFGDVEQGKTVRRVFALKNAGASPVRLARVDFQLPGMKARFKPVVPAGGEGSLEVEWSTQHLSGPLETVALVEIDGSASRPIPIDLKIHVTPLLEVRPLSHVFLSAFVGEAAERELTIENHRKEPVDLAVEGGGGLVDARLQTVTPGRSFKLKVRPAADVKPGRYEDTLTVASRGDGAVKASIPVHLLVKPDLYANPEEVDFGRIPAGRAADGLSETFLVKRRAGPFHVTSVSCPVPGVEALLSPEGASETFRVDVRLKRAALTPGTLETKITIATDDPRFPEITVPVRAEVP